VEIRLSISETGSSTPRNNFVVNYFYSLAAVTQRLAIRLNSKPAPAVVYRGKFHIINFMWLKKILKKIDGELNKPLFEFKMTDEETNTELHSSGASGWQVLKQVILPAAVIILLILTILKFR